MSNFITNIKNTISFISTYNNKVVKTKKYYVPLLLCVFISYSFNIYNRTVSIDDITQSFYYGSENIKIKGLRWGQVLIDRLFSTIEFTPFINKFIGILFLVVSVVLISSILFFLDNKKDDIWKYTVFSCIFISYPLINEIWEYFECLTVPICFSIVAFSILYQLVNDNTKFSDVLFLGAMLSIVMSGYESLIFAYITIVLSVVFIKYCVYKEDGNWVKYGFRYALPLFAAFILKFVIGYSILFLCNLEFSVAGDSGIKWFRDGFKSSLLQVLFNGWYYGIRGLSYFPITEFDISITVFIILCVSYSIKTKKTLLIGLFLLLSLFFLPILQGAHFGYRMAQTIQYFIPFVSYMVLVKLENTNRTVVCFAICLFMFVSLRQSIYLHNILALNNLRSDNEAYIAREIGYDIVSNYPNDKEVIFVGKLNLGDFINSQITIDKNSKIGKLEMSLRSRFGYDGEEFDIDIVSTNVNSYLTWAKGPFYGQTMIKKYISFYGFDINMPEDMSEEELYKYENIAKNSCMKPLEIKEFDKYILVYLGD